MEIQSNFQISASKPLSVSSNEEVKETSNVLRGESAALTPKADEVANSPPIEEVKSEILNLNHALVNAGQGIAFSVDEKTNEAILQVVDRETNQVIKQFPSEDSLKMIERIQNHLKNSQTFSADGKQGLTGALFNEII